MGLLHRLFHRDAPAVWRAEARLMHRLGLVRPPEAVQWISTSVCDLTCPHCYSNAGRKSQGELTAAEAKTLLIDELVRLDRPVLVLAGGETLLRRDLDLVLAHAKLRQVPWAIHTHGGKVLQKLQLFRDYPPVIAAVSLDGPREYHDEFRGREGSFDAALRAIRALRDLGVAQVVAGTTINRRNADLLADMLAVVLGSGAHSWGFHLMTPEGRAGEHRDLLATPVQLRRVAGFARRLRSLFHVELDNEWGGAGPDDPFYRDDPFFCGAGRISCVVSASGEVMPCTTTDLAESQGNVRDKPLGDIWASGFAAFRTRSDSLRSDCDDCWLQTRHGHSCRSAFTVDLLTEDHDGGHVRRVPLGLLNVGG